jgi:hypothetical protein
LRSTLGNSVKVILIIDELSTEKKYTISNATREIKLEKGESTPLLGYVVRFVRGKNVLHQNAGYALTLQLSSRIGYRQRKLPARTPAQTTSNVIQGINKWGVELRAEVFNLPKNRLRINQPLMEMLQGNTLLEDLARLREVWMGALERMIRERENDPT